MTACKHVPPRSHPFHGTLVACHMHAGHEGPHTWEMEPSKARRGIDRLLEVMAHREIDSINSQLPHPLMVYEVDEETGERAERPYRTWDLPAGPWVLVRFVGGDEFAIWKETGAVYRVGPDGAVEEEPILKVADD